MLKPKKIRKSCSVLEVRKLTESTTVVRFERNGLDFEPGQYIRVGIEGDAEIRDYSVYSGTHADYLEVLVRRVEDGLVSRQLCDVEAGEQVRRRRALRPFQADRGASQSAVAVHCDRLRHIALPQFYQILS